MLAAGIDGGGHRGLFPLVDPIPIHSNPIQSNPIQESKSLQGTGNFGDTQLQARLCAIVQNPAGSLKQLTRLEMQPKLAAQEDVQAQGAIRSSARASRRRLLEDQIDSHRDQAEGTSGMYVTHSADTGHCMLRLCIFMSLKTWLQPREQPCIRTRSQHGDHAHRDRLLQQASHTLLWPPARLELAQLGSAKSTWLNRERQGS